MTKNQIARESETVRILSNDADSGKFGRAFELACARPNSRKARVSAQGRADVHIKYNGRYVPAECKINGGRVDTLLDGTNKARFVVYALDFVQKHKATKTAPAWDEVRHIDPVIIPTDIFVAVLRQFNAIKEVAHNGVVDGIAIQPSSKKLFQWLSEWPVEFHNDWDYTSEDFEGLGV